MTKVVSLNLPKFDKPKVYKKKGTKKKLIRHERQDKLLRLFDGEGYEEFHHPKYVFVKHWNGDTSRWQVAIYTKDSWAKFSQPNTNQQHLYNIMHE